MPRLSIITKIPQHISISQRQGFEQTGCFPQFRQILLADYVLACVKMLSFTTKFLTPTLVYKL